MDGVRCDKFDLCLTILGKIEQVLDMTRELLEALHGEGYQGPASKKVKRDVEDTVAQYAPLVDALLEHIDAEEAKPQMRMANLLDQADNKTALNLNTEK